MIATDGLFRAALETVSAPLILWGGDGTVAYATRRFQESFGIEPRELEGKSEQGVKELLARAGARLEETVAPPIVDAPGGRHYERRVRHLPEGGRLETFRDITEAASAAARREEILGVATHDLRSPLANVRSYASLLLGGSKIPDLDPRVRRAAEVIARNADRALRLVQAFFDSCRAETGEFELELSPTPLGVLLEETLASRRASAAEKGVQLQLPPLDGLPAVAADRERLRHTLGAFLDHAIERSSPGQAVELRSERKGRNIWLGFYDEGLPLAPEQIAQTFDRDSQILHERRLGVGFALAVARAVAQAHGGSTGGERSGERMVFFLSLPALER